MMKSKFPTVEPFVSYPESVIDSEEKAFKVLQNNCYYFYVMGIFAIVSSGLLIFHDISEENVIYGIQGMFIGLLYISLAYLTLVFKSKVACYSLAAIMIFTIIFDLVKAGLDGHYLFKVILCFAVYRMTKAIRVYNE